MPQEKTMVLATNTGDSSSNIRPTEAQLRWAQFHHKRRAHLVNQICQRLYQTPQNLEDVSGAYPEDGNSTTSISDAEIRRRRPKVSRGRRAYLRVSKRNYNKRIEEIVNHGFRRLQGAGTFSDGEEDLDDIFMTKRRRPRRKGEEGDERLRRFEAACHAMMMNLAQPEEQLIVIPSKRWTRTADHIAASATLEEEYLDPKWGIRRRVLPATQEGTNTQFNLHRPSEMPLDRGASWLVHLPDAIPSSREFPSRNFYISDPSHLPPGSVFNEALSEGGQTVSTLAMAAPGQQKFNQLVALAQQRLIERGIGEQQYSHPRGISNVKSPVDEHLKTIPVLPHVSPTKSKKTYMPRMRLRDFVPDSEEKEAEGSDDEMSLEELMALNQIPREKYLEAVQRERETGRRLSRTQEMAHLFEPEKNNVSRTKGIAKSFERSNHPKMRLRKLDEVEVEVEEFVQEDLHPEELVIMNSIVGMHLRKFDIANFEDRSESLDRADWLVQKLESEEKGRHASMTRQLFYSISRDKQNSEDHDNAPVKIGDAMALQQIIRAHIEHFNKQGNTDKINRLTRAQKMALAFEVTQDSGIGHLATSSEKLNPQKFQLDDFDLRQLVQESGPEDGTQLNPEELVVMQEGIRSHLRRCFDHKTNVEIHDILSRAKEVAEVFEGSSKEEESRTIREMFDMLRGNRSRQGETLQIEEVIVLQGMVDGCIEHFEALDDDDGKCLRLRRAKLIAHVFEAKTSKQKNGRIKEMVESLERNWASTIRTRQSSLGQGGTVATAASNDYSSRPSELPSAFDSESRRKSQSSSSQSSAPRDSALHDLWNRGRNSLNSLASTLNQQSSDGPLPTQLKETAASVSERVNLLFQGSANESVKNEIAVQSPEKFISGMSVSQRLKVFVDNSASGPDQQPGATLTPENLEASANVSGRVGSFFQTSRSSDDPGRAIQPSMEEVSELPSSKSDRNREYIDKQEQQVGPIPSNKATLDPDIGAALSPHRRKHGDGDSSDEQPFPPHRSKAEQEVYDAMEASTPKRTKNEYYEPDEFDADFLAAYRKKRESMTPSADDASSASSFQALPSGFREVVKQYSPSRRSHQPSPARKSAGIRSQMSAEDPKPSKMSAENVRKFSESSFHAEVHFDQGIIDTDGTTSETSNYGMNPSLLSSLMLSPDLLTKRHQQAVRAIERKQWDDVNYLVNANPWLAEMSELTTKQYLLHKIAFFGSGSSPAPLDLCQQLMAQFPAAVHKFDEDGNVPIHLAAAAGHMKMITMLGDEFESGASIRNEDGMLPLHFTIASYGQLGGATPMKEGHNEKNLENPGPVTVIKTVLKFFPQAVAIVDNEGNLPLHIAADCLEGTTALDVISLLLDEAERQLQDPYGARFYNKVKIEEIMTDGVSVSLTADTEAIESMVEPDTHCTMVRNELGESPLLTAIHARKGWQVIEALVSGPGGQKAALYRDADHNTAMHLLVNEFQDPTAALSILKKCPESSTIRNKEGMLPIEVACMQLMPEEVILAIALSDLHIDINDKEGTKVRPQFGGSWWFLACECDDHYVDIVQELVSMCSFQQVRLLCLLEGGSNQNKGTVISRATPKCREVLSQAIRFMGRFEFVGNTPLYSDPDIGLKAFDGLDFGGAKKSDDEGRRVVLKCYSMKEAYLNKTANLRSYNLDNEKVEEVCIFSVNEGGGKNHGTPQQFWISTERPEVTLKDVAASMIKKGGYWNEPELRTKYAAKICSVLKIIAKSLRHIHSRGVIHGDLNLESCGKFDHSWKLLDRLSVQAIDQPFDMSRFQQSFPPESLHSVDNNSAVFDSDTPVSFKDSIIACPAIDIWAFGKLAYEAIMGKPLVEFGAKRPSDDVVALLDVMDWGESSMRDIFTELLESGGIAESGAELFTSCLFARPEDRPVSMEAVLSHRFWHENQRQREKSRRARRRRNTDSISAFNENTKSLFTEESD